MYIHTQCTQILCSGLREVAHLKNPEKPDSLTDVLNDGRVENI